jgi:hypothetical protein
VQDDALHPRGRPRGVRPPHGSADVPLLDLRPRQGVLSELSLTVEAGSLLPPPLTMAAIVHASPEGLCTGESNGAAHMGRGESAWIWGSIDDDSHYTCSHPLPAGR